MTVWTTVRSEIWPLIRVFVSSATHVLTTCWISFSVANKELTAPTMHGRKLQIHRALSRMICLLDRSDWKTDDDGCPATWLLTLEYARVKYSDCNRCAKLSSPERCPCWLDWAWPLWAFTLAAATRAAEVCILLLFLAESSSFWMLGSREIGSKPFHKSDNTIAGKMPPCTLLMWNLLWDAESTLACRLLAQWL